MAKFKVGDRIVFGRCKANKDLDDVTVGKIYKIEGRDDWNDLYFIDDQNDRNSAGLLKENSFGKATKIID
jgi:hypothetical protein